MCPELWPLLLLQPPHSLLVPVREAAALLRTYAWSEYAVLQLRAGCCQDGRMERSSSSKSSCSCSTKKRQTAACQQQPHALLVACLTP